LCQALETIGSSLDLLAPATKLKRLSFGGPINMDHSLSTLTALSEVLPNLQCILHDDRGSFGDVERNIVMAGKTMLVPRSLFVTKELDTWKQLAPVISPSNQPLLLLHLLFNRAPLHVIRYVVNELKYDVNAV